MTPPGRMGCGAYGLSVAGPGAGMPSGAGMSALKVGVVRAIKGNNRATAG